MSIFAKICLIASYDKVAYYSVAIVDGDDEQPSYFQKFVDRHQEENKRKLNHLLSWLQQIGKAYGAKPSLFREEREAQALPPKGVNRRPTYIEMGEPAINNLRLYCYRLSERVVFLFDGDVKTADAAQDCPQVRPHFRMANQLARAINEAFKQQDIEWNDDCSDIIYDEDFLLIF